MGPTRNIQGTYKFMSVLTGLLIKSRSFTMLPMPSKVIKQVDAFANKHPQNILFADREGRATIGALSLEKDGDLNDDGEDGYDNEGGALRDEESLYFDVGLGEGDAEVTYAAENILLELPGTVGYLVINWGAFKEWRRMNTAQTAMVMKFWSLKVNLKSTLKMTLQRTIVST